MNCHTDVFQWLPTFVLTPYVGNLSTPVDELYVGM